jgi:hypothetical protein
MDRLCGPEWLRLRQHGPMSVLCNFGGSCKADSYFMIAKLSQISNFMQVMHNSLDIATDIT